MNGRKQKQALRYGLFQGFHRITIRAAGARSLHRIHFE